MSEPSLTRSVYRVLRPHLLLVGLATGFGIANGLCVTALLATVNRASTGAVVPDVHLAIEFVLLCLAVVSCNVISNMCTTYAGQRVLARMRCEVAERILSAPIAQLERFGSHKLVPILVQDTAALNAFILAVAPLIISLAITISGIVYLTLLSWQLVLLTAGAAVLGLGAQWIAQRRGVRGVTAARDGEDLLQKYYEAISDGAKELRIQRPRRHHVLNRGIRTTADAIARGHILAALYFVTAEAFATVLFFAVIGIAIVLTTFKYIDGGLALGGFILVMLYLKGPLEHLTNALPFFTEAQVALQRITQLTEQFSATEPRLLDETVETVKPAVTALDRIELRGLRYAFAPRAGAGAFELGPVDLTIRRGDIVFIVGENGAGKTTLIKLLLGLYAPHRGSVSLDGREVTSDTLDDYRQLFATIFSDGFLFDELPPSSEPDPGDADALLTRLELAHKVRIQSGAFSTTALSSGQRKRLALISAFMEKRPVLVFDEWAADQDPGFRRVFYTELLPELQQAGKTIIAISHDDRYFGVADQLLRMESGRIIVERRAAGVRQPLSAQT